MYLKYLWYIIKHKWFVFVECCRLGIPFLGIIHDLSKFLPDEFVPYARWFYGDHSANTEDRFDFAWNAHQKRNKHHWQYWILREDNPEPKEWAEWMILSNVNTCFHIMPMPDRYRREMLADWRGAGRAITGKDNTREWYLNHGEKDKIIIHRETRKWIEQQLNIPDSE